MADCKDQEMQINNPLGKLLLFYPKIPLGDI